ncbi:MAG: GTP-binding protein [Thermoguttaceae bacterium]|nr:GTP-binding protein [Thermoguttaceae bacterium]
MGAWTPESAGRPYFGLFRFDELDGASEEIVLRRRTANSLELNCHGGDLVSSRLTNYFVERGAVEISGNDWERAVVLEERGFLDDQFDERLADPIDALFYAATDELIAQATTELIARLAIRQRGLWRDFFTTLSRELDRPDGKEPDVDALVAQIDDVLSRGAWGRRLCLPIKAALLGAPNVGKSSLLNAALGYDRAVVSPTLGTTRDLVDAPIVIDGWNFRLIDAAGLHETSDEIERIGMRLASESAREADVVLKIYDVAQSRAEQDALFERFLGGCSDDVASKSLIVLNKTDLPESEWDDAWKGEGASGAIKVSAKTLVGLEELSAGLVRAAFGTATPGRGPAVWTPRQIEYLKELRSNLLRSRHLNE